MCSIVALLQIACCGFSKAHLVCHASYDGNMSQIVETAGVMQVSEQSSGSQSSMVELPQATPPNPTAVSPSHAPSEPQVYCSMTHWFVCQYNLQAG